MRSLLILLSAGSSNRCAASLLEKLEEEGLFRMAYSFMDLLVACNPKDLAQCDSQRRARDILEREAKEQWEDCAIEKKDINRIFNQYIAKNIVFERD